jgi:hypothetical protein
MTEEQAIRLARQLNTLYGEHNLDAIMISIVEQLAANLRSFRDDEPESPSEFPATARSEDRRDISAMDLEGG